MIARFLSRLGANPDRCERAFEALGQDFGGVPATLVGIMFAAFLLVLVITGAMMP